MLNPSAAEIEKKAASEPITGSQALVLALLAEGVSTVFGYPGGAIMPVYDALYDFRDDLKHVLVRHEQGAAHAAEGYARVTGRAGVCIATSGPGATNLVTGIADAMLDSVPIVCITGQVGKQFLGTDAFQETDVIGVTMPVTKWNYQITSPDEIPYIVSKAFYLATHGRPGPVLIDITKNAQIEKCAYKPRAYVDEQGRFAAREPAPALLEEAARLINEARKPYMLIGHGVLIAQAEQEVIAFAEKTDIPLASTLLGLSAIPTDHPNYVGMLGMHGNYGPNVLSNEADLIIAVGMRFDDRVTGKLATYARKARIVHIDIDPAELGKNVPTIVSLQADAKKSMAALLPLVHTQKHEAWHAEFKRCAALEQEKVIKEDLYPSSKELRMSEVIRVLSEKTKGDAVVVTDVGQHQMSSARYYSFKQSNSFISSGGLGTMGFALPAAMGAAFGTQRQVLAIIGDGGFQMTFQELGTIAQESLPVKIIILNNNFLGMVRQWQELFFEKRYSFVEMKNPDFVKLASAFGIQAETVTDREQLSAAVERMLVSRESYLLDIRVEKETNIFPMVPAGAGVSDIRLE